jgi:hypothetical protein
MMLMLDTLLLRPANPVRLLVNLAPTSQQPVKQRVMMLMLVTM